MVRSCVPEIMMPMYRSLACGRDFSDRSSMTPESRNHLSSMLETLGEPHDI